MGDDSSVVQAARVSYGQGAKTPEEDRNLIRYLMRNKHTSPFEMVEFKFHIKAPIFVFRQWIRHRTCSANEISQRYSEAKDEYYVPEINQICYQSKDNKQGRSVPFENEEASFFQTQFQLESNVAFSRYNIKLSCGMAKELARINLPLSTYSEMYWKMDLHNLFHFLKLRLHPHAQYEIRVYAQAILDIIKPIVPISCEAFEDYILNAQSLSGKELEVLGELLKDPFIAEMLTTLIEQSELGSREKKELKNKLF
jgi:thymidylate synthase (FAD)